METLGDLVDRAYQLLFQTFSVVSEVTTMMIEHKSAAAVYFLEAPGPVACEEILQRLAIPHQPPVPDPSGLVPTTWLDMPAMVYLHQTPGHRVLSIRVLRSLLLAGLSVSSGPDRSLEASPEVSPLFLEFSRICRSLNPVAAFLFTHRGEGDPDRFLSHEVKVASRDPHEILGIPAALSFLREELNLFRDWNPWVDQRDQVLLPEGLYMFAGMGADAWGISHRS